MKGSLLLGLKEEPQTEIQHDFNMSEANPDCSDRTITSITKILLPTIFTLKYTLHPLAGEQIPHFITQWGTRATHQNSLCISDYCANTQLTFHYGDKTGLYCKVKMCPGF